MDSAQGLAACAGLADRIELCAGLDMGGLTPSPGLMQAARDSGEDVHVLIRPQAGDFSMNEAALKVAIRDIRTVKSMGLAGVVIGAVTDQALDTQALVRMIAAADGLTVTLHRAIDTVRDPVEAVDTAIALGIKRILTSGAATSALDGAHVIAAMQVRAEGRITIMAGSGITPDTAADIVAKTGVRDIHASCSRQTAITGPAATLGFGKMQRTTDRSLITALRAALA